MNVSDEFLFTLPSSQPGVCSLAFRKQQFLCVPSKKTKCMPECLKGMRFTPERELMAMQSNTVASFGYSTKD